MKVRVDADLCVGHGRCYALAPEVFGADEMGHCAILDAEPTGERAEGALRAIRSCPEGALSADD